MEPAAKRARTEEQAIAEPEDDAPQDMSERIGSQIGFHVKDTTLNVMQSNFGNILMPLTDGGLQYFLAGARASCGVRSGRYAYEVTVLELINQVQDPAAKARSGSLHQLRVGFSLAQSSLLLGSTEDSVCFDMEGGLTVNGKRTVDTKRKFGHGNTVAVVLNLDNQSANVLTVSLFVDGRRTAPPQRLPERMVGKALFPAVAFKNLTLHYNFGPELMSPLPFGCRTLQDASAKDVVVTAAEVRKGLPEVVFPISLPDEGSFDWLDQFLETHPTYHELSARAVIAWAEASGVQCPKGFALRNSRDKPEMSFGIKSIDELQVLKVLEALAKTQQRDYVVMEVKGNLLREEREERLKAWPAEFFRRTAVVAMGKPTANFTAFTRKVLLQEKQAASDKEFRLTKLEQQKAKLAEKKLRQVQALAARNKRLQKKKMEEASRQMLIRKKEREAKAKGEEYDPALDEEVQPKAEDDEDEPKEEEDEEMNDGESPPTVELSAQEKATVFRKTAVSDLSSLALGSSFTKFQVPSAEEGFDELRFDWSEARGCAEYLNGWIKERKNTVRVEAITPGEFFTGRLKEWAKVLASWQTKQKTYKAAVAKKARDMAVAAEKVAKVLVKEKGPLALGNAGDAEAGAPASTKDATMEDGEEKPELPEIDFDRLDVYGVEDVADIGAGQPLFSHFGFEDWALMGLRFELNLLALAFRKDVDHVDGMYVDHIAFYYQKYFKKVLNLKSFGVESIQELLPLIRDTVVLVKSQILRPQVPDEIESFNIFAMMTEEARRERNRRVDMGDESARLKMQHTGSPGGLMRPVVSSSSLATGIAATPPAVRIAATPPAVPPAGKVLPKPFPKTHAKAAPKIPGSVPSIMPTWKAKAPTMAPAIRPTIRPAGLTRPTWS